MVLSVLLGVTADYFENPSLPLFASHLPSGSCSTSEAYSPPASASSMVEWNVRTRYSFADGMDPLYPLLGPCLPID